MEGIKIFIARQAFDFLAQGWATGNFQPFIEMLSDDVIFWLPVGKQLDKSFSYADKQQIIARFEKRLEAGDRLTFSPPDDITSNETSVTFEFEAQGTINHQPVTRRNAISFDIREDKIVGIREYFGDID
ncbi:nuclear transport factor 2 family protein [Calothrix sp. 336/3]|uniref:nuclear transport factor 2 family protein n=1 Tax=Calothrix sp. 336/3 TaxID=1337936 RepID=UPI0004E40B14|nr:nuclear transport factor 2 family protein [Calothrix sp. 336/3]AKG24633.1 hypothetical protein IJ00_13735 [Calothrix sp. 336/3]